MGCDIHLYTEIRARDKDGNPIWISADKWVENPYWYEDEDENESKLKCHHVYDNRNYHVFAILADVRNYNDWPFISKAKGFPEDASKMVKNVWAEWGEHTPSYLTLKELKSFDWNQILSHVCRTSPELAEKFKKDGEMPDITWAWSSGPEVQIVVKKPATYWVEDFLTEVIPYLEERLKHWWTPTEFRDDEDNIRIVFWFDS